MTLLQTPYSTWSTAAQSKFVQNNQLKMLVEDLRKENYSIATLNGSFDLLHAGHLEIIFEASQICDRLIVALNTDASIKRYKGIHRPLIPLEFRMQMMAALSFVDYVTFFDEDDPRELLSVICPDVHVNGSEYGENCIEAEVVKRGGGRIHIVELVPGLSTTQIIKKISSGA